MLDWEFVIFCTVYISMLCVIIITCIYIDFDTLIRWAANQNTENIERNNDNLEDDLDQETFETLVVSQPPYLHMVDFTQLGQGFSNSDLPPSYENCILESQPPSCSVLK